MTRSIAPPLPTRRWLTIPEACAQRGHLAAVLRILADEGVEA